MNTQPTSGLSCSSLFYNNTNIMSGTRTSGDGGWPGWAKCVTCYEKMFAESAGEVGDTRIQDFYGERDFYFLPCAHVVCSKECLIACRGRRHPVEEMDSASEEVSLCPCCHHAFVEGTILASSTLRPLEVVGRVHPQTVRLTKKCQGCIRKNVFSIKYCENCSTALCKYCVDQHCFMVDTAEHSVIESPYVYDVVRKSEICSGHPSQRLIAYCNDCDLQFCQVCVSEGKHAGHDTCDLKGLAEKTFDSLKSVYMDHCKISNEFKTVRESLQQKFQAVEERTNTFQSEWACEFETIATLLGQQEFHTREDIVSGTTFNAYTMNLRNTCYKSLISQAEVFRLFAQIFDFMNLPQNRNKFVNMSRFYNLLKKHIQYTETTLADVPEILSLKDVTLTDNTEAMVEAVDKMYRIIPEEAEPLNSEVLPPPEAGVKCGEALSLNTSPYSALIVSEPQLLPTLPLSSSTQTPLPLKTSITTPQLTHVTTSETVDFLSCPDEVGIVTSATRDTSSDGLGGISLSNPSLALVPLETLVAETITVPSTDALKSISPESLLAEPSGGSGSSRSGSSSADRHTILESETDDDTDNDVQRVAFMCDYEDSSDEERVRIKNEPIDYEDRDEEPPDDEEEGQEVPIVIKKEINYYAFREQDYQSMDVVLSSTFRNGHARICSRTPDSFFCRSDSNTSSEDGERNSILPHRRLPTPRSRLIKVKAQAQVIKLEPGSHMGEPPISKNLDILMDASEISTQISLLKENIPQNLIRIPVPTTENETMISSQPESNAPCPDFESEFILPNVPSPFSDNAASDEEFFKNVLPDFSNLSEQDDETEPDEVLDPQTGLLIRRDSGCVVDADIDIADPGQGEHPDLSPIIIGRIPDIDNELFTEKENTDAQTPTLPNVEHQKDKDPKVACATSTLVIKKILVAPSPSPATIQVKPASVGGTSSPPSNFFTRLTSGLTPDLLKFAHARGQEIDKTQQQIPPVTSTPTLEQRAVVTKGNSTSVEIQTDAPSAVSVIPLPLIADMNIIKTEPKPQHHDTSPSDTQVPETVNPPQPQDPTPVSVIQSNGQPRLNRIFKSKNHDNNCNPTVKKLPGLNKNTFHNLYKSYLTSTDIGQTEDNTGPSSPECPPVVTKRKRGRPVKTDPKDCPVVKEPPKKRKRGRPVGWRKTTNTEEEAAQKSPVYNQNNKRTRLSLRQSSPASSQQLSPADKIRIKTETAENGESDEYGSEDEVAPPPPSPSPSRSRSSSTSNSEGRGERTLPSLRTTHLEAIHSCGVKKWFIQRQGCTDAS